ncbi:spore coat protein F [Weizmannia acidilactici]|uniref:Spore coat protein F n=1 Tax=Weizmannia acidilactici TaxID=2607726 RepID=A0A5J4JJJ9_9BACI|nr:spore coat protein [Weizmannia acidilactici]GER70668.1 spore coat protein F [Weizmannia acidilactici]
MPKTLAWHETLEIHELVASQTICLIQCKSSLKNVTDDRLRELYTFSVQALEKNIRDLLQFYPQAPREEEMLEDEERQTGTGFQAGELLSASKSAVRNYAIAITETATPALRNVLIRHLNSAIDWHARVFNYMHEHGMYQAYNLSQLLNNDVRNANRALQMREEE